ncbi:hypothetical protein GHT06_016905 [Daphnia sinensis]|uniref:Uncharacterized protein n=1 Tax=Daphnia sinensis TaxID=1820382 RepID=A0AAD5KQX0_9CRUS|nr:hypothetical protein GHT06_016905 [Daphnia sinensis]
MVRSVKDLLRRSNGRACLDYMELEASLIEIESVINARPLSYIGEGADDPIPITPNQFLNNRRSTRADPEPAANLLAPTSTSTKLLEMDKLRREYVADICSRFVDDYLRQLDNFHSKGKSGRKIQLREDRDEDVEVENPEPDEDLAPLIPAPEFEPDVRNAVSAAGETDSVVGEVEPEVTGSSGEYVGNTIAQQTTTTRSGRRTTAPAHLRDYCLRGPR